MQSTGSDGEQVGGSTKDQLELPHVTTTSLPALRLYAAAAEALKSAPYARSRHIAEAPLRESLAADPAFATTHLLHGAAETRCTSFLPPASCRGAAQPRYRKRSAC